MKRVKIADLRNHLSRYLDHVRAGGTLVVLDRNRPIAEVRPIRAEGRRPSDADEAILIELERKGVGRRTTRAVPRDLIEELKNSPPVAPGARLLEALLEEREESW